VGGLSAGDAALAAAIPSVAHHAATNDGPARSRPDDRPDIRPCAPAPSYAPAQVDNDSRYERRLDTRAIIEELAKTNPAWAEIGEPAADGTVEIPDALLGITTTFQAYHERLGAFLANILILERALDFVLTVRFTDGEDGRLFNGAVLRWIPLGDKVNAAEDVLTAYGYIEARDLAKRAMACVQRRNKLAHQPADIDDTSTGEGNTVLRLIGRRSKITEVTFDELDEWSTAVTDSIDELLFAAALILYGKQRAADHADEQTPDEESPANPNG